MDPHCHADVPSGFPENTTAVMQHSTVGCMATARRAGVQCNEPAGRIRHTTRGPNLAPPQEPCFRIHKLCARSHFTELRILGRLGGSVG